jgi:hypothetical protein
MKKIVFTTTVEEAEIIKKAIHFFYVSNTNATAENPEGLKELSAPRMEIFGVNTAQISRLQNFLIWLDEELASAKKRNRKTAKN